MAALVFLKRLSAISSWSQGPINSYLSIHQKKMENLGLNPCPLTPQTTAPILASHSSYLVRSIGASCVNVCIGRPRPIFWYFDWHEMPLTGSSFDGAISSSSLKLSSWSERTRHDLRRTEIRTSSYQFWDRWEATDCWSLPRPMTLPQLAGPPETIQWWFYKCNFVRSIYNCESNL